MSNQAKSLGPTLLFILGISLFSCAEDPTSQPPSIPDYGEYDTYPVEVTGIWYSVPDHLILFGTSDHAIWSIDPDTGEERHIFNADAILGSVTGERLVAKTDAYDYASSHVIVDANGSVLAEIHAEDRPSLYADFECMVWGRILFQYMSTIWEYETSTGVVNELLSVSSPGIYIRDPSWAPNGQRFVYQLHHFFDHDSSHNALWIYDRVTGIRQLEGVEGHPGRPKWSPDGRHIGYTGCNESGCQIYVIDPNGGVPHQISQGDQVLEHFWSPSGNRIACLDIRSRIVTLHEFSGELLKQIAFTDVPWGFRVHVCWVDDQRIVYNSPEEPGKLILLDLASATTILLGTTKEIAYYPREEDPQQTYLGVEFEFTVDPESCRVGTPIDFTFEVLNHGPFSVGFGFPSTAAVKLEAHCSGAFAEWPGGGQPAVTIYVVRPGESLVRRIIWDLSDYFGTPMPPGDCTVEAYLLNGNSPRLRCTIHLAP